jgi:hypothetical protein
LRRKYGGFLYLPKPNDDALSAFCYCSEEASEDMHALATPDRNILCPPHIASLEHSETTKAGIEGMKVVDNLNIVDRGIKEHHTITFDTIAKALQDLLLSTLDKWCHI